MSGRRSWSDEEKLEILAEAFRPGVRVGDVIARREVASSLIYTWRKQVRSGKLGGVAPALPAFAEVRVAEVVAPALQPAMPTPGVIRIELPCGVPVTATGTVTLTPAQLSMLLEGIDRRRPERTFVPTPAG